MSASTSTARPSGVAALAAALRAPDDPPTPGGPSKIDIAERAWATSAYVIPRKAQFFLDALLDRLHRARDDVSETSPVVSARYWKLCRKALVEIEEDQLGLVVARHAVLPFVAACLRALSTVTDAESLVDELPAVLGRLLPLALRRANGEQVLEVVAAAYSALARAEDVDDELATAIALVLSLCDGALTAGTVTAPKKAYQQYLRSCLPPLLEALRRADEMPVPARTALLASAQSALYSLATLQRQGSLDELVAALVASAEHLDVSPSLLGLYIAAQRRHASTLYPLPARGGDEPSRAAAETHELTRVRAAVWAFFEQIVAAHPALGVLLGCIERIGREGMYATGSIECRAALAATIDRALEQAADDGDRVAAYVLAVVEVDERAVAPHLARVFALVARSKSAANVALVDALRSHAARTRQLPTFVDRLVALEVAERDARDVLSGPLLGVEAMRALAIDIRTALSGSQLLPLVERLVTALRAAIDAPEPEPSPKKRRTSTAPTSSSPSTAVRAVITAHVLATVIEAGDVPKAQLDDFAAALEGMTERICTSVEQASRSDQHVLAASLHLRHSIARRLIELGRSSPEAALDLRQSSPDATLASARCSLQAASQTSSQTDVLDTVLGQVEQTSAPWSGGLYFLQAAELPTALWSLVLHYLPLLDRIASDDQLDRVASLLLVGPGADSADIDVATLSRQTLLSAGTAELLRLRAAIARSFDTSFDATKLGAIALLPASYLPSETRKSFVRRIVASPSALDDVGLGYLRDVARDDPACARTLGSFDWLVSLVTRQRALDPPSLIALDLFRLSWLAFLHERKSSEAGLSEVRTALQALTPPLPSDASFVIVDDSVTTALRALPTEVKPAALSPTVRDSFRAFATMLVDSAAAAIRTGRSEGFRAGVGVWTFADWLDLDDAATSILSSHCTTVLSDFLTQIQADTEVQLVDPTQVDSMIALQAYRLTRVAPPTHAIISFMAACTVFACTQPVAPSLSVAVGQILRKTSNEQYAAVLELIGDRLRTKLNPSSLLVAQLVLISGPDTCRSLARGALGRALRTIRGNLGATASGRLKAAMAAFLVGVTDEHAKLLDRDDVGCLLGILAELATTATAETYILVVRTLSQVQRQRPDALVSAFAQLASLTSTVLVRLGPLDDPPAARALGRLIVDLTTHDKLAPGCSKHAPFVLLRYLRRPPARLEIRAELATALRALVAVCGPHEREALLGAYLRPDEDAERDALKALVAAYERTRYRGEA